MSSSVVYVLAALVFELAWFLPFRRIFRQAHFHPAFAFLSLIPMVGPLACAWLLSTLRWPLKSKLVKTYL